MENRRRQDLFDTELIPCGTTTSFEIEDNHRGKKRRHRRRRTNPTPAAEDTSDTPTGWRPYYTSYLVMGKIESRPVCFLVDSGCTTHLIENHVFDQLLATFKTTLRETHSSGRQVDGTHLRFYEEV